MASPVRVQYRGLLLTSIFISYLLSLSLFLHIHYVGGVAIMHSHPFSPDTGHEHTQAELLLLDRLTHFDSNIVFECIDFNLTFYSYFISFTKERAFFFKHSYLSSHFLRAPPIICFI